ncbi:MAG: DUF4450 domain-containing protein [Marinilabiliaceae bacterium]|nr:DUF4450 domain-containing protein [Marinilabiliaceae bacterium]
MTFRLLTVFCLFIVAFTSLVAQPSSVDAPARPLRYRPDGDDFVIVNGTKRFNRALYGTNTGFRVEAGDLPEFAMYMPRFGGNLHLGISNGKQCKWLKNFQTIEARYRAGSMIYTLRDSLLGKASLKVTLLALSQGEGMVLKVESNQNFKHIQLVAAFGGATDKRFSREGDMNADPADVFDLKPDNCVGNRFDIRGHRFFLQYGNGNIVIPMTPSATGDKKQVMGIFPASASLRVGDAALINHPQQLLQSSVSDTPVLVAMVPGVGIKPLFFQLKVPAVAADFHISEKQIPAVFQQSEADRARLASRIRVSTPDPYINTLGAALAVAADAIWEDSTYLHGAIGWRMRLNGWRGPYTADPLGWHDRAKGHFRSYTRSQITDPAWGPSVPDPAKNLARQEEKLGNALFTSGYICRNPNGDIRPHHYDMNLVFIDALMRHFRWTGDTAFMREMWPVVVRHLDWEKRNFDADNDGLYDAYCCIWASDALQYSGGAVTHSSAYNYFANTMAAQIAGLIGEDGQRYALEAQKINEALRGRLWMPSVGHFAEYREWMGEKPLHPSAALWTIYHALDSEPATPQMSWQASRYIETGLPRLFITSDTSRLVGDTRRLCDYYVHATTNWQPYDWSINNVVMAENLHAALAHWQAGRSEAAFDLWKATLLDAMYLGGSPANFVQLSALDASRGEMYRDFADEVGMTARSLVEGLFGFRPDALCGVLNVTPGLPDQWNHAALQTPDLSFNYQRNGSVDRYELSQHLPQTLKWRIHLKARGDKVVRITVNGRPANYTLCNLEVFHAQVVVEAEAAEHLVVEAEWGGDALRAQPQEVKVAQGDDFKLDDVVKVSDPQQLLKEVWVDQKSNIHGKISGKLGHRTLFARVKQGDFMWWMPVPVEVVQPVEVLVLASHNDGMSLQLRNDFNHPVTVDVWVNHRLVHANVTLQQRDTSPLFIVEATLLMPGDNWIEVRNSGSDVRLGSGRFVSALKLKSTTPQTTIDLSGVFNARVTDIFQQEYLTPRWPHPTLQLPKHGVGNWCYPNIHPVIDDSGLRENAKPGNRVVSPSGVMLATPSAAEVPNVAFASLWDNYPDSISVVLQGKGRHLYLMMAGSTNPMQSRMVNGTVTVRYADGSGEVLPLVNPDNWCPIEQDYLHDGKAFDIAQPAPVRLHLKTGWMGNHFDGHTAIKGYSNRIIDGGAAVLLDMPIHPDKMLESLTIRATTSDVIIGLMAATVVE